MRRWLIRTAVGLAVGAFVILGAAGGGLYWNRVELHGEEIARSELPALAADEIPKVLGYEYKTVERSLTEAYPLFTPDYRREFVDRATNDIIPQARELHLVNQVNIVGVGVLTARRTTGSVLVYMNRTMTDKSKKTLYDGSRLRVDYRKVDDKWLIDSIAPI
ncbi:MAG: mammalian cell entry protein [Mycobacterium sp.]